MDTEKKPGERTDQPKPEIGEVVGDLVVSTATVLANSAAKAVVNRFKKQQRNRRGQKPFPGS